VYEITVELQQHHTSGGAKPKDTAVESSAQGAETFNIYSIGSDGTAFANVDASFQGTDKGTPFESHSTSSAKVMPDGRLLLKDRLGLGISEAMSFANTTSAEIAQRELYLGAAWTSPQTTPYVHLALARRVAGVQKYQGYTAYEVETTGAGDLLKTMDGNDASGTVSVTGTSYYDQPDRLLIGEALRTLTVVERSGSTAHDDYSTTMNVVLRSWTHATPALNIESGSGSPIPEETETTEPATPAPAGSYFGPTPYPTVTPRLEQ
jgi:hypothetical protein